MCRLDANIANSRSIQHGITSVHQPETHLNRKISQAVQRRVLKRGFRFCKISIVNAFI